MYLRVNTISTFLSILMHRSFPVCGATLITYAAIDWTSVELTMAVSYAKPTTWIILFIRVQGMDFNTTLS